MIKRIAFTGGGTAGHVTPNLALIPHFLERGWEVHYIGTAGGMERELIEPLDGVTYHAIHSGKLRRYFAVKNFTDPFRVLQGAWEAGRLMRKLRPGVLFSKGGFVSVPVVFGAFMHKVPVVLHESDSTPGLANRLAIPMAKAVCTTFPEAAQAIGAKAHHTGTPLREALFRGERARGIELLCMSGTKPILLMMGGSTGATAVNKALRTALPSLLPLFDIAHICGRGNVDKSLEGMGGYRQIEYVGDDLPDVFAAADFMLSRAGANALCEILALQKPMLLVPYPLEASRGDQIHNAASFERRGLAMVLPQNQMTPQTLTERLLRLWASRDAYLEAMEKEPFLNGTQKVIEIIEAAAKPQGRADSL